MSADHRTEERLAELLRALPPAPQAWVQAAQELPLAGRAIDQLVALAEIDASFRAELLRDAEAALEQAGVEATPELAERLRERLDGRA